MKHTMLKCLSLVMALATLVSVCALPAIVQAATPCNHYAYTTFGEDSADYVGVKESTCTEWGGKVYTCPKCNKDFVDSRDWANGNYKPLGHNYVEVEGTRVNPTLTEAGKYTEKCTRCGDEKEVPLSAIKCTLNGQQCQYNVTNTATCTEEGIITKTCKVCGDVVTEASPALGHTWDQGTLVKAPECGTHKEVVGGVEVDVPNYGTIKFVCTVDGCDGERVDDKVLPAKDNHKWEWHDEVAVTCGADGNTAGYTCVYCDAKHPTDEYKVIPTTGHTIAKLLNETELKAAGLENVALGCVDEVIWGFCSACEQNVDVSDATATGTGVYPATGLYKPNQTWTGNHYVKVETVLDQNGDPVYVSKTQAQQAVTAYNKATMFVVAEATCTTGAMLSCNVDGCEFGGKFGTKTPHNWTHDVEATCETYGYKICGGCGATAGYADEDGNPVPGMEKYNIQPHTNTGWVVVVDPNTGVPTLTHVVNPITVVGPGCTTYGYDEFECIWCKKTIQRKNETATPLGHAMTEAEGAIIIAAKNPTCTEPGCTEGFTCGRGDACSDKSINKVSQLIQAPGHDWEYHAELPANCQYGVHNGYLCKVCGIEKADFIPTVITGAKDPSKHVFDGSKQLITEPTCSKPGLVRNYCIYCYDVEPSVLTPTHHSFEIVENGVVVGYKDPIGMVPATCQSKGYYVYFCTNENCDITYGTGGQFTDGQDWMYLDENVGLAGAVTRKYVHANYFDFDRNDLNNDQYAPHYNHTGKYPYVVGADFEFTLNWNNVPHDSDGKPGAEVGGVIAVDPNTGKLTGSCGTKSWYEYDCSTCGTRYQELRSDDYGPTGSCVESAPFDSAATCTVPGYTGRTVCTRCGDIMNEGTEVLAAHTYDKSENATIPYTTNVLPGCTTYGWAEHGYCTVCKAEAWTGKVNPTGHTAGILTDLQFRNCYVDGWDAHYNCINGTCDAVVNNAKLVDANGAPLTGDALTAALKDQANWVDGGISATVNGAYINGFKPKYNHDMDLAGTDLYGCMDDGYQWFVCSYEGCDHVYVQNNYYFGFANHRYTDKTNVVERADGTLVECADSHLLCDNKVQVKNNNTITLVDCNDKKVVNVAVPHKNDDNELIKGFDNCANWDKNQDHVCVYCKVNFDFVKVHQLSGNYKANHQAADCKNWAHDVYTCNVCNYEWIENVGGQYGDHVWKEVETVAPSYIAGGYTDYECSVCGETKQTTTKALEGVKVDISAANKFEGYEIFDGSIVAVKVTTSAFNVGATSIKVTMTYNKDVFTYIGFSADNAFGKASFDGLANVTYNPTATNAAYGADGVVTMASVAEKTANGQLQNVTLNGKETYMTLYFRVANNATSAAAPFGFEIVESTATEENTQVLGVVANATTGALETAPVKTVVGDAVELATEINKIADINGDLIIGMEDVEAMRKLVLKAAGYTAPVAGAADIDKDGDVDIDDYALLQKYILGMIDYTALANELVGTAL